MFSNSFASKLCNGAQVPFPRDQRVDETPQMGRKCRAFQGPQRGGSAALPLEKVRA